MGAVQPVREPTSDQQMADSIDAAELSRGLTRAIDDVRGVGVPIVDPTRSLRQREADALKHELDQCLPGHREQPVHGNRGASKTTAAS